VGECVRVCVSVCVCVLVLCLCVCTSVFECGGVLDLVCVCAPFYLLNYLNILHEII
jgi:hypothetical protein